VKAKVTRGNGFRGILNYSLGPGKKNKPDRARIVASNMAGRDPRELAREFGRVRQLRPDIKNPVWHCSMALPAGERTMAWDEISEKHLQNIGVDTGKHQWLAVRHDDTDHDHVHIILNRIALDGMVWHGKRDVFLVIESTQQLEKEFGLKLTPGLEAKPDHPKKTRGQTEKEKRAGQPSAKVRMQKILNQAMESESFEAFVQFCEAQGLALLPNVAKTGKMNGFSFRLAGSAMKASDLGSKYKWVRLAETTGFDQVTHQPIIERLAAAERARPRPEATIAMKRSGGEAAAARLKRRRTLDLVFLVNEDGAYCWRKRGTVAFEDMGDRISMRSTSETAIRAALQLALKKGWTELEVSGSPEFRRATWIEGMRQGVEVSGYEPDEDDLALVAEIFGFPNLMIDPIDLR
jgi:hypothetical protein